MEEEKKELRIHKRHIGYLNVVLEEEKKEQQILEEDMAQKNLELLMDLLSRRIHILNVLSLSSTQAKPNFRHLLDELGFASETFSFVWIRSI